jgi:hypothetical protein
MKKQTRQWLILVAVAILFFLGINGVFSPKGHVPPGQPAFVELDPQKMDTLRQAFNADQDKLRIVLWAAPT